MSHISRAVMMSAYWGLGVGLCALAAGTTSAWAAPCCAGGGSLPAVITGDEAAQLSVSVSQGVVIGDAPAHGIAVFRSSNERESSQLLKLDAASIFLDRWQAGISVPLIRHESWRIESGSSAAMALGDIQISAAYEALPEWEYSEWKPKGYLFAQLTAPSGKSVYESTTPNSIDVSGKGFYTVSAGAILVKRWNDWDMSFTAQTNHSLERSFEALPGSEPLSISGFWGASAGLGVGWSHRALRAGFRIQPTYLQSRQLSTPSYSGSTAPQLSWDTALDVSYLLNDDWSLSGSYVDQTLVGPAINASLSRTFALTLQKRWAR